ncbi:tRNA (adenosine(37)-N6)-threonylcarbamoyltransferase complex ATPase subunit type 1 TsaE [Candidatus Saccharibacteria bacterium]|nr:tRNA (adenosine(37)-N6)-threonylcarbamoyltransferase complex ATPase subunit type 1 TsaE [Candidatus Saccharibacteria bacterium]
MGELLGRHLKAPALVELRSDLGGGKTTFVKGLARGIDSDDAVTSPSFTLSNIYLSKTRSWKIDHFDFYRLKEAGIMADELSESLQDDKTITVVEWGDIVEDVLPEDRLTVEFKPVATNTDERQIIFSYPENQAGLIKQLETEWTKVEP